MASAAQLKAARGRREAERKRKKAAGTWGKVVTKEEKAREPTPYEKLAGQRGVDLPAEQARAEQQISAGQRIGGVTQATKQKRAGMGLPPTATGQPEQQTFQQMVSDPYQQGITAPQPQEPKQSAFEKLIKGAFTIPPQTFTSPFTGETLTTNPINALQMLGVFGNAVIAGKIPGAAAKAATGKWDPFAFEKATGKIATNTATAKLRLASALPIIKAVAKNWKFVTGLVAGWVTTGVMAQNEWGDAVMQLNIGITQLTKDGDVEGVRELKEYLDDISPERMEWYMGPIAYVKNVDKKIIGGIKVGNLLAAQAERENTKIVEGEKLEGRINSGDATPEEIAQYAKDFPYSQIAKAWASGQQNLDAQGNSIFGAIDEKGVYVPSATEEAKAQWESEQIMLDAAGNPMFGSVNENGVYVPSYTELAKRLEQSQYYVGLGGDGGVAGQWEPPSSLNFGLLHTSGGYEATGAGQRGEGDTYTVTGNIDRDEIAKYLFGIPYEQLSDEQKGVVDKW